MGPPTTLPASPSLVKPAARISLQPTPTSRPAVDPIPKTDPPQQSQPADPKSKPSSSSTGPVAVPNSAPAVPGGSPDPGTGSPDANAVVSVADPLDPLRLVPSKDSGDPDLSPAKTGPALAPTKAKTGDGGPVPTTDYTNQPSTHPSNSDQGLGGHQGSDSPNQPSHSSNEGGNDQISNRPDPNPKAADPSQPKSADSILSKQLHTQITQAGQANSEPQPTTPVVIGKQTFSAGPTPIVVAGVTHSIAAPGGNIIVNGHTMSQAYQPQPSPALPSQVLSIGSQRVPFRVNSASEIVIDSHTLRTNSHIVIASHTIALDPSATDNHILVNDEPTSLPALGTPKPTAGTFPELPSLTVAGQTLTHNSAGGLMIGSHILVPGGHAITISGTSISIAPASQITVDGSTIALSPAAPTTIPNVVVGGHRITENEAGDLVIASTTLQPGSAAITVSNTPISLAPSATQLVVGSSTIPLLKATQAPAITFKGQTITADSASQYVIAGQTLTPGGVVTVSGTPLSLDPAESRMMIGSSTIALSGPVTSKEPLRVGGQTLPYSINAASAVVVAGSRTLTPGGAAITISGTLVSEIRGSGSARPEVVIGKGPGQTTEALGGVIMSGFGPAGPTGTAGVGNGGGSNGTSGPESFTGVAAANRHGICVVLSLIIFHLYVFV